MFNNQYLSKLTFWFHYNKLASKKAGKPQITLHWRDQCILVDNIDCRVPTIGKINKRQPFFVLKGKASRIDLDNNIARIF